MHPVRVYTPNNNPVFTSTREFGDTLLIFHSHPGITCFLAIKLLVSRACLNINHCYRHNYCSAFSQICSRARSPRSSARAHLYISIINLHQIYIPHNQERVSTQRRLLKAAPEIFAREISLKHERYRRLRQRMSINRTDVKSRNLHFRGKLEKKEKKTKRKKRTTAVKEGRKDGKTTAAAIEVYAAAAPAARAVKAQRLRVSPAKLVMAAVELHRAHELYLRISRECARRALLPDDEENTRFTTRDVSFSFHSSGPSSLSRPPSRPPSLFHPLRDLGRRDKTRGMQADRIRPSARK